MDDSPINYDNHINRRSSVSASRSISDSDKNRDGDEDILPLTLAFMYAGKREIPHIIRQFLTASYGNEKFSYAENHSRERRSAYYWDWNADVSCTTTQSGVNQSVFTTICTDSGRITQYCFSADDTVYVNINGSYNVIALKNMKQYYNNSILSYNNGKLSDAKFLTFVHIDVNVIVPFLNITLNSTHLAITKNHLLYRLGKNCNSSSDIPSSNCIEKVFSEDLQIGDFLYVLNPNTRTIEIEKITDIRNITLKGIYSPMTEYGHDFFVNNILVSPFSTVNQPILNTFHYVYAVMVSYLN